MFDAAEDDPPPPAAIDPDSLQGRLTLIEERLTLMSIELDSLKARTARRRHRAVTKQQDVENRVKIGLAVTLMFVLALFLLYAELAPSPDAALGPSTVIPPVGPSTTTDLDSHFDATNGAGRDFGPSGRNTGLER